MWSEISQRKAVIILGIIIFLAFLVRVWDIEELFIFKMDQARDIALVQEAYDGGAGELPLLGPRAAKTYLRLGPIFYYFEYISMWITDNKSPLSVVWPDFIFSILTIPLFYYFLRQVFSQKISLMTTAVFASSFFLTQYGRFAWNPNAIPFWSLLFFLGMYKVATLSLIKSQESKLACRRGMAKNPIAGRWLLVAVIGYGVSSQLHFTAALAYPLIATLFWLGTLSIDYLTTRRRFLTGGVRGVVGKFGLDISWKYWLGAFVTLGIFYVPMILSEMHTNWDNWTQFKYALSGRGKEEFSLYVKIIQSLKLHSEYFYFSLTSFGGGRHKLAVIGFVMLISGALFSVLRKVCINFQFSIFNFQSIINLLILNNKKDKENCRNNENQNNIEILERQKMIWLILIFVWAVVMGLLYTKLSFNVLKPRYWLLEAPLFFIWLAVAMEGICNLIKSQKSKPGIRWSRVKSRLFLVVQFGIVGFLILINLYATGIWYWEVSNQRDTQLFSWDLKLKDENKISYGQLEKVVDYIGGDILALAKKENKDVCFYMTGEYRPVYDYILEKQGISNKNFLEDEEKIASVVRRISFGSDTNESCLFLAIDHQGHRERLRIPKKRKDEFVRIDGGNKEIGFVTIWQIIRKIQDTNIKKQTNYKVQSINNEQNKINSDGNEDERGKVDQGKQNNEGVSERIKKVEVTEVEEVMVKDRIINEVKKNKKPKRKERVRWKDIF